MDRLKSLGYVGSPTARGNRGILPDWTHVNAVAYNAELDQIMISVRSFGEFWIIDHGTTTAEAAGHNGWKPRQGRRPPLPLGQPGLLPRRHQGRSAPLRPARRPLDSRGLPRRGARHRLQQRRRPAGGQLLVGRRDRRSRRRAGRLRSHAGRVVRSARAGLVVHGAKEGGPVRLHHVRCQPAAQR